MRSSVMHRVLEVVGDPWTLRIVPSLAREPGRFQPLLDELGLPRATLAARLRALVAAGCVQQAAYARQRFDYRLSPKGVALLPGIWLLRQWNQRWAERAPAEPSPLHRCGAPLQIHLICGGCRQPLEPGEVKALDLIDRLVEQPRLPPPPTYRRTRNLLDDLDDARTVTAEACIGDRWASLVIGALFFGLHRFGELSTALAIAPNILSSRLQLLTHAAIVERRADGRVYALTRKGLAFFPAISALHAWGDRWLPNPRRTWRLLHRPCADWLHAVATCRACDEEV